MRCITSLLCTPRGLYLTRPLLLPLPLTIAPTLAPTLTLGTMDQVALMYPLGLGLTTALSSLKTFGGERIVFWREAALGSGMFLNSGAYFLAKVRRGRPQRTNPNPR